MRKVTWPPCRLPYPSSDSLVLGGEGSHGEQDTRRVKGDLLVGRSQVLRGTSTYLPRYPLTNTTPVTLPPLSSPLFFSSSSKHALPWPISHWALAPSDEANWGGSPRNPKSRKTFPTDVFRSSGHHHGARVEEAKRGTCWWPLLPLPDSVARDASYIV